MSEFICVKCQLPTAGLPWQFLEADGDKVRPIEPLCEPCFNRMVAEAKEAADSPPSVEAAIEEAAEKLGIILKEWTKHNLRTAILKLHNVGCLPVADGPIDAGVFRFGMDGPLLNKVEWPDDLRTAVLKLHPVEGDVLLFRYPKMSMASLQNYSDAVGDLGKDFGVRTICIQNDSTVETVVEFFRKNGYTVTKNPETP